MDNRLLAAAAQFERDRRGQSYPHAIYEQRISAEDAAIDYQCWCAIAEWFEGGHFRTFEGGVDGRTLVDWTLAEDAAEKALAKAAERVAAAERDPDFDPAALAERRSRRAGLTVIHRAVQLRRQTIERLNAELRGRAVKTDVAA